MKGKTHKHRRISRELETISQMIRIYCSSHHNSSDGLCTNCNEIMAYAEKRLDNCPFQENKPTCANCSIHCYNPRMQEKIIAIMRFSGPKMVLRHPALALAHLLDSRRATPLKKITPDNRTGTKEN